MNRKLTPRQEAFANRYLDGNGNGAENYRIAYGKHGCSDAQAASEAFRLRRHPLVAGYIREGQRWASDYSEGLITRAEYARGLTRLSREGPTDHHIREGVIAPIRRRFFRKQTQVVWHEPANTVPMSPAIIGGHKESTGNPEQSPVAAPIVPMFQPPREPCEDALRRRGRHEIATSGGLRL